MAPPASQPERLAAKTPYPALLRRRRIDSPPAVYEIAIKQHLQQSPVEGNFELLPVK